MGIVQGMIHVRLDDPLLDVKLCFFDLAKHLEMARANSRSPSSHEVWSWMTTKPSVARQTCT
jgi:hypothetical protein